MQRFIAVVSGESMWPTYADGERLVCSEDVSTVGADSVIDHRICPHCGNIFRAHKAFAIGVGWPHAFA